MNKYNNKQKRLKIFFINIFIILLSFNQSFAQDNAGIASQNFRETADNITNNILTSLATLLMTAAFVLFFYGVVIFILGRVSNKGDMKSIEKGKEFMLWGMIALFVMVSVWGIIKLAQGLFGVDSNEIKIAPVQFASLDMTNPNSSNTSNTNPLNNNNDSTKDTNKPQGSACTGKPGSQTECASGLYCRDNNGIPVAEGVSGTCKATLAQQVASFPVIKVGQRLDDGSTEASYAASLFVYLKWKKCTSTYTTFGTVYDSADAEFVKNFQKFNGLVVDGEVGEKTWAAVVSPNSKSCN